MDVEMRETDSEQSHSEIQSKKEDASGKSSAYELPW